MLWLRRMRIGLMGEMCQCLVASHISRCKNRAKRHLLCNICEIMFYSMSIYLFSFYYLHVFHSIHKKLDIIYISHIHTKYQNIFNPIPPSSNPYSLFSQHPQPEAHKTLISIYALTISSHHLNY